MFSHDKVEEELSAIGSRDHLVTNEYRIFGPPGTGKTRNLTIQIQRAADKYGVASVLATSFSRAAAAELAGQELPISSGQIGTLHSLCWKALGKPPIAEANVDAWNRKNPQQQLTAVKKLPKLDGESPDEDIPESEKRGDKYLAELNRVRGRMQPEATWRPELRAFASKWRAYKTSTRSMDFCDLIDTAVHDLPLAPGRPSVIVADEAQDLNPMQLRLVRRWGDHTEYFMLAADDDQTIYGWCGATAEALLDPDIPNDHKVILRQSYRVPRTVHELASRLIRQVSRRQEKLYDPRPEDGDVIRGSGGFKASEYWILKTVIRHLEQGERVMLLAACSYMLHPVTAVLRKHAIPFHNPYRKSHGFWNPLRLGRAGSANRILSLLVAHPDWGDDCRPWTYGDFKSWSSWLRTSGILKPNTTDLLEEPVDSQEVCPEHLHDLFEAGPLESLLTAFQGDYRQLLGWWQRRLAPSLQPRVRFPIEVTLRCGPKSLTQTPQMIVGTVHSVKGGQADVVFLFPDISRAGAAAYERFGPDRDSVIRQFYVGLTRARKTVYICQQESPLAIRI